MDTGRSIVSAVAYAAVAALATSCASEPRSGDADLRLSGVGIVAEGCGLTAQLASGVVVDRPGQVVTVAHAIAGATSISVVDHFDGVFPATVRAFDKDRDLAVLDVPGLDVPALDRAPGAVGPGGTLTWSRDGGVAYDDVSVTRRLTVTIEDIYVEEIVERSGIEVRGDVGVGDSGGAVLSPAGDVIGIIYAQSRTRGGVGFATDSSELDTLLQTRSDTSPRERTMQLTSTKSQILLATPTLVVRRTTAIARS